MGDFIVGGMFGMLLGVLILNAIPEDVTVDSVMSAAVACDSFGGLKSLEQGWYEVKAKCNNGIELVVKREHQN